MILSTEFFQEAILISMFVIVIMSLKDVLMWRQKTIHRCNCDANLPVPLTDTGIITNSTALPVQKLYFGGLNFDIQLASFTLGRLKCYG